VARGAFPDSVRVVVVRGPLAGALLSLALLARGAAGAPAGDFARCDTAFSTAPKLTKSGRLLSARAELAVCAADPCPASMRQLCSQELARLDGAIPTAVFVARSSTGADVLDARVLEGDRAVVERLDGRAVPFDPGPHVFRFERSAPPGGPPPATVETSVVLAEGEQGRRVSVVMPDGMVVSPVSTTNEMRRPIPWTVYLSGGVAVAAAASFAVFGVRGVSERASLGSCKGSCSAAQVDAVSTSFDVADALLATSAVALAVTAVLYFTRPSASAVVTTDRGLAWSSSF
jgi:hypothetical protein